MLHISLFSGMGGFDLASEWMGWTNIVSCEINPFGNRLLEFYWPQAYHHDDIKTLTYEKINQELTARFGHNWRSDDIILTGGFPCQPYSMAGKRLGKEDERHLWPEMLRTIKEIKPRWVVGENVRGLLNWNGGLVFDEVCSDLESLGYQVTAGLIPACATDAPHKRERIWIIAHADTNGGQEDTQYRFGKDKKNKEQFECSHNSKSSSNPKSGGARGVRFKSQEAGSRESNELLGSECGMEDTTGTTANTDSIRCDRRGDEVNPNDRRVDALGDADKSNWDGDDTNPNNKGLQGIKDEGEDRGTQGAGADNRREHTPRILRPNWEQFPTQSPIRSIDDGISGIMVRNINPKVYATISEKYTNKDLQEVWEAFQSEEIRGKIGRLYKIHEPGLLLQTVQLCTTSNNITTGTSCFSEKASEKLLRKLQQYKSFANSPYGRKLEEQFSIEFANTLPYLSHEIALVTMEAERASRNFASWHRNESIKAAGNAVVPQVVYAIFKSIEAYEQSIKS